VSRLGRAAQDALRSGRFISPWTILVAMSMSVTVMSPRPTDMSLGVVWATLGSTGAFLGGLLVTAVGERRVPSRARSWIVIAGILVSAALRPLVYDAIAAAVDVSAPAGWQLPFRMLTNATVWAASLTGIAILTTHVARLRRTNARLLSVRHALAHARDDAGAFERSARELVTAASAELSRVLRALAAGQPDAAALRAFSDECLRPWSRRLDTLAAEPRERVATAPVERSRMRPALRLPPPGVVALVYALCVLPYALRTVTPVQVIAGIALLAVGTVISDGVARLRAVRRFRIPVFLAIGTVVGGGLTVLASAQGVPFPLAAVPLLAYPVLSVAGALCAGVISALRVEERRLTAAVRASQRIGRTGTSAARAGLEDAARILHRDAQGACVRLLASSDAWSPTSILRLHDELDPLLSGLPDVFARRRTGTSVEALLSLIDTWSPVVDVRARISPAARAALERSMTSRDDAFEIVAEGLLNAVKHSVPAAATIDLDIVATGAGPRLRVLVRSPGRLPRGATLRASSAARARGARLRADGSGALLEAVIDPSSSPAVVSPEHRPRTQPPSS
jgi:Ca2+/Na+ antiporter